MTSWLHNRPGALLAGLVLGIAIQEALRSAVDGFVLLGGLGEGLVGGPDAAGPTIVLVLMVTALIGGLVAGLVTASLARSAWTAVAAGVLLTVPSVALAAIALDGGAQAALHAVPPVCGTALGARLVLGPRRTAAAASASSDDPDETAARPDSTPASTN